MAFDANTQRIIEAGRVFTPAAPVDESALFAGRRNVIRTVLDVVFQRGQHAIIFGERGVGKTSLANVLVDFVSGGSPEPPGAVLAPRVNCDTSDDFTSIWRKIFSTISVSKETAGIGFAAETTTEVHDLSSLLPQEDVTPDDVRKLLSQLGGERVLILVVDEFDRLTSKETTSLFADTIKTLSDHSIPATLVLVGVADSVDELIAEHESIERALVQVQMPRMSAEELHQIVINGLERLDMEIDPHALNHISLLSQGLPHYTHLLSLHAARQAIDAETFEVQLLHVEAAIDQALNQAQQSIRNAYHQATTSPRRESLYRQVLLACALAKTDELGYFSPANVRDPMSMIMGRPYDIPSFSRHLKEFSERGRGLILQKTGRERRTRFRFINPLMQPYVIMRGVVDDLVSREQLDA